ncbi:hypothetical protein ACQPYK_21920 [Streptosporangium sp. CA-135522]|uniref:hypothetical protein n=1 Tax=Streptosporangium sp. CA-135522 TaxID=3240072 RepID=UPI003D907E90
MLTWTTLLATAVACGQERPVAQDGIAPSAQEHASTPSPAPEEGSKAPADTAEHSDEPRESDIGPDHSLFEGKVTLADGRRVAMHYRRGEGLFEQHQIPNAGGWTKPRLIYRTRTPACQGIELQASDGTVTAIADFGLYCADGEPPTESIAAVGMGDLRRWDHHLTKDFDGWERVTVTDHGRKATFVNRSLKGHTTLVWTLTGGFSDPVDKHAD